LRNRNIAVADRVFDNIRVYSPEGEFQGEISGTGSGPGEFNSPLQVTPWREGFAANSLIDRKILFYNSEYEFVKEISFNDVPVRPGCPIYIQIVSDSSFIGHSFFFAQSENGEVEAGTELALWNGNHKEIIFRKRVTDQFNPMTYQIDARINSCIDTENGYLYWADASSSYYTINCVDLNCDSTWVFIDREFQLLAKPDSVIEQERQMYIRSWREGTGQDPDFDFHIDPYYRAVEALNMGPEGKLWVMRGSEGMPVFDVYAMDGSFSFQCTADISNTQLCDSWAFAISSSGILAYPRNPESVERIYIMELRFTE